MTFWGCKTVLFQTPQEVQDEEQPRVKLRKPYTSNKVGDVPKRRRRHQNGSSSQSLDRPDQDTWIDLDSSSTPVPLVTGVTSPKTLKADDLSEFLDGGSSQLPILRSKNKKPSSDLEEEEGELPPRSTSPLQAAQVRHLEILISDSLFLSLEPLLFLNSNTWFRWSPCLRLSPLQKKMSPQRKMSPRKLPWHRTC